MDKKKKLLYIVEAFGGGIFTYMVSLANEMSKDFDVYIAYGLRKQTPDDFQSYFNEDIHFIRVKNFKRSIGLHDLSAFFEIKKIVKEVNPDIVHLHSSKAGILGRWGINGKKTPLFYTPHGYSFLMSDCSKLKRVVYSNLEKISAKRNCTTISCSIGEHNETLMFSPTAKYVSNGVNTQELDSVIDKIELIEHQYTVCTSGRICFQKNPQLFNEIALLLPDVRFLWIGDGELRDELTSPNIEITGWENRTQVIQDIANSDVFILTSLWEGLPMSLLEAMYLGKMCLVTDIIGNRDVIRDGVNGYVCHNAKEFVSKMFNDLSIGAKAKEEIEKTYNTKKMAEQYKDIYMEVIQ